MDNRSRELFLRRPSALVGDSREGHFLPAGARSDLIEWLFEGDE
jgi:hypothetical protein